MLLEPTVKLGAKGGQCDQGLIADPGKLRGGRHNIQTVYDFPPRCLQLGRKFSVLQLRQALQKMAPWYKRSLIAPDGLGLMKQCSNPKPQLCKTLSAVLMGQSVNDVLNSGDARA